MFAQDRTKMQYTLKQNKIAIMFICKFYHSVVTLSMMFARDKFCFSLYTHCWGIQNDIQDRPILILMSTSLSILVWARAIFNSYNGKVKLASKHETMSEPSAVRKHSHLCAKHLKITILSIKPICAYYKYIGKYRCFKNRNENL